MATLTKLGLIELVAAAWSGWAMVLVVSAPDRLRRLGVHHFQRVRQWHLDLLLMGVILTAVGAALGGLSPWVTVALVAGAYVQPNMFLPLAFNAAVEQATWYRAINGVFFVVFTAGWTGVLVDVVRRW